MLEWRLKASRHLLTMEVPKWSVTRLSFMKCLDEVDPELAGICEQLGIPLREQGIFAGVAVDAVAAHESIAGLPLIGTAREKAGVISFIIGEVHPHDAGTILAVRAGHQRAQPVMDRL